MKNFGRLLLVLLLTVLGCGQSLVQFPEITAPTVSFTNPANHAVNVATNTKVNAAFSEVMDATTITTATFVLTQAGTPVPATVTYAGTSASLAPTAPLAAGTRFTATITTAAKDTTGNALAADFVWSFTTGYAANTTAPTVTITDPANNAVAISTNTRVSAAFSEAMDATTLTTTTFTLMRGAKAIPGAVTYSGLTATFTPTSALGTDAVFTATITTGAKDLTGNALAAAYVWSFTTSPAPFTTPPTVTITDPANKAVAVPTNTTVSAAFSDVMAPTTLTPATFTLTQGTVSVPGAVTYAGLTATFTPTSALAAGTVLTATITTGAMDLAGNALAANYVWSFTTAAGPGATPPTVTMTDPANKAISVATDTKVSAAFSEVMDPSTLTTTTFTLMQGALAVPGAVTYSGLLAIFTPTTALAASTAYTATITTGAKALTGNALAASYVWGFTTAAGPNTTAPTVTITDPADKATGVSTSATVRAGFSEAMDPTTLSTTTFTLMQGGLVVPGAVSYSGLTATLTPTSALTANTAYTATITTGAKDLAGNALAANYVWSFTTSAGPDTTAPTVTFTDPTSNANGVDVNTTVQVGFDKTMDCTTFSATTFTLMQGATGVAGAFSCAGPTVTFTPTNILASNAAFTATVTTGVKDSAGIALAANYVWSFSTGSLITGALPTIISTTPATATPPTTNVAINTSVTATFNEVMNAGTFTAATFTLAQLATPTVLVAGNVSYAGTTATLAPTANLLSATSYIATVTTGVTDLVGTAMAADYTWTFTTGTAPTVISTNPANAARGVALDRAVDATFSVAMNPATINTTTFTLSQAATPIAGTLSYAGTTATFTPTANYPPNVTVTATITTGAQDTNGNALLQSYVWSFETGTEVGQGAVPLGAASTFAILSFNTVTNVNNPGTIVNGDIGIYPGTALVGFPPGVCNGSEDIDTPAAQAAEDSLLTAYNNAVARALPAVLPGDLSGLTFTPGLYANLSSVELSAGNVTLDAQGDSNAVFIFQISTTLTTIGGTEVILAGGAKATNIFWAVGTSATLGTTSIFKGTILAAIAITADTGAVVEGRLLTQAAAVSLDTNIITVPSP